VCGEKRPGGDGAKVSHPLSSPQGWRRGRGVPSVDVLDAEPLGPEGAHGAEPRLEEEVGEEAPDPHPGMAPARLGGQRLGLAASLWVASTPPPPRPSPLRGARWEGSSTRFQSFHRAPRLSPRGLGNPSVLPSVRSPHTFGPRAVRRRRYVSRHEAPKRNGAVIPNKPLRGPTLRTGRGSIPGPEVGSCPNMSGIKIIRLGH